MMEYSLLLLVIICEASAQNLVITNDPVDAIACIGDTVNIPCGFVNESGSVRPDWRIIRRNNDGIVISDMSVTGLSIINNPNDGLQWIVDQPSGLNHTNSVLVVGPVDDSHNLSSYQCYFTVLTDDNVFVNVTSTSNGTLTVFGPPSIREFIVSDNCSTDASISWDPSSTDPVCLPVSYDVTISPSDGVVMMRINDTSYNFTGLRHNDTYTVTINASNSAGNIDDLFNHSLTTAGPPFSVESFSIGEVCINDFSVSWDPVTGNPVCGPVSYDVTISSSDGVVMRTTDTSYNFTGLMPNNSYTVTVAGRNDAGVGGLDILNVPTPSLEDGLPSSRFSVNKVSSTENEITLEWNDATVIYCGNVLYNVSISSISRYVPTMFTKITVMELTCDTDYEITVIATNRAGERHGNVTARTSDCDGCWPMPCLVIIIIIIIICILILLILIDCGCYYYIYKNVKSGSEPHSIIVIIFVIFTAGVGWVLYKYLTKTKGPSKIGMQDSEKTPSPDDEPVAYTTTETDKVTFGTSDSTDTKKKKQKKPEMVKKPAAEPANQGGLMYADLDIGKGPAAPGSIFPQEKPTYGQVKPSN